MKEKSFPVFYKNKTRKVKGYLVGDHIGIDFRVGAGWYVNHIPTGRLVTDAGFLTINDAQHFAEIMQRTFGDVLSHPVPSVIRDNLHTKEAVAFYGLRVRLESLKRLITTEDIDGYLNGLVGSNAEPGERISRQSLAPASIS